jgi:tetratricopeptide (TPR) repeat protein
MLPRFTHTLTVTTALLAVVAAGAAGAAPATAAARRRTARPVPARNATSALRLEGSRAFRAGRYEEALQKFRAAAELDREDPDALADVALALQKLGRTSEAIAANLSVLRIASRPGDDRAGRLSKLRLTAYSNLGRLSAVIPAPEVGACGALAPAHDSCKPLYACREAREHAGSDLATRWEVLRIGRTSEAAVLDEDDYHEVPPLIRGLTDGEYESEAGRAPVDVPEQEGDALLRYGMEEVGDECRRIYGDWSCEGSDEVRAEARRCQGPATAVPAGARPARFTPADDAATAACFRASCDRAESAPWPAVQAEIDRKAQRLAACYDRLGRLDDTTCVVVYADPCSGFIGTYCTTTFHRTTKPGVDHHRVFELTAPRE